MKQKKLIKIRVLKETIEILGKTLKIKINKLNLMITK